MPRTGAAATATQADSEGVICAFTLGPARRAANELGKLPDGEAMWLHLNLTNAKARSWLDKRAALPEPARAFLLEPEPPIQVEVLPDGLVASLGDLHHDFHGEHEGFGTLRVYLDERRIVTARRHPLEAVDRLRREADGNQLEASTPIAIFERLIEHLAQGFSAVTAKLGHAVDDAEEVILAGRVHDQGQALSRMRRSLARLRRQISANRAALAPLPGRLPAGYSNEQRLSLRQAVERLEAVGQDLELVMERARLLQEEIAGRLGEATNRNLFLLSIVTTTLLPITLITGIFGMNVDGLPWLHDPRGFWWVMGVIVTAVVLTLVILRRRRVL